MNTAKIKAIFERLAKEVCEIQDDPARKPSPDLPTLRGGEVQSAKLAEACGQALHEIALITEPEGIWTRSTVDDTVWEFVGNIADLNTDRREAGIRERVANIVKRFAEEPSEWIVDVLVYGLHESCAGLSFGKLEFLSEEIGKLPDVTAIIPDFPAGNLIFARLKTQAINEVSAVERAGGIIDEHLMILNALCSSESPSWIQVSRVDQTRRYYSANRVGLVADGMGPVQASGHSRRIPLMGAQLDALMQENVGARVSQMLSSAETEFNLRILSAYQFAGAACVDGHPERSFLMLAIALESAVLGRDTKTELTYQLGSRVAHLIGNGLKGRKLVAKTVNELYGRRSKIVHVGEYGVSRREAALIHLYCMTALTMLVISPVFSGFTASVALEDWFKDRMLDGSDHFPP
jgi:hypothetical protein